MERPLTSEDAEQVRALFREVVDLGPEERTVHLTRACRNNADLRREVEAFLAASDSRYADIRHDLDQLFLASPDEDALHSDTLIGQRVSHYQIQEKLGGGGMGTVYKAHDTHLDRTVALKFLPTDLTRDPEAKDRFIHEAQAASGLDHVNICTIYETGETSDGRTFIAMACYDGETLKAKIERGPLPLDEAIGYTLRVAEGLKKAHGAGIIHRDVKPANVIVTADGVVKIVDFGLAKVRDVSLTQTGRTLGTVAYMSPEQARGEAVDPRTDIWSLGVVVYEMVVGRRPFRGGHEQSVIHSILHAEPDPPSGLRTGVPLALEGVVLKCLSKDPEDRYQHVEEIPVDLRAIETRPGATSMRSAPGEEPVASGRPWLRWAGLLLVVFVMGLFAGNSLWRMMQSTLPESADQGVKRWNLILPEDKPLAMIESAPFYSGQTALALSPDGNRLVYVAKHEGTFQLYLRRMDAFEVTAIPGTEGAYFPFFSPDGQWVGFFAGNQLKKVSLRGGEPITLCEVRAPVGATWGPDDRIIVANQQGHLLSSIPASASGEDMEALGHAGDWPAMLPGGDAVLVSRGTDISVVFLDSGAEKILLESTLGGLATPRYVPTGHLVYAQRGRLMAAPFDLDRLEVKASPVSVLEQVRTEAWRRAAQYAISEQGTLVYVSGGNVNVARLVWVDHQGAEEPLPFYPRIFGAFALSPNSQRVAVTVLGTKQDLWIYDLERALPHRLTTKGNNFAPLWTPDGERVAFASRRESGPMNVYWKRADGVGEAERLTTSDHVHVPTSFSRDSRWLAYQERDSLTGFDLWALPLDEERTPQLIANTQHGELNAVFSPDGRHVAYYSDESGRSEVYVQAFPEGRERRQVSRSGGLDPIWSPNGDELFYHYIRGGGMAARVETEQVLTVGTPRVLFEGAYLDVAGKSWSAGSDGRFLVLKSVEEETTSRQLNVVVNWFEELKRLVPTTG